MFNKSIFYSKTFWFNTLSIILEVLDVLPVPPGATMIAVNLINIALRWITSGPVSLTGR